MGKLKLIAILLIILIVGIGVGAAVQNWIISDKVTVTVQEYALTLQAVPLNPVVGEQVTLSGKLTLDGVPVPMKTVRIFFENGTSTGWTDVTDSSGDYSIGWIPTRAETVTFYANATLT